MLPPRRRLLPRNGETTARPGSRMRRRRRTGVPATPRRKRSASLIRRKRAQVIPERMQHREPQIRIRRKSRIQKNLTTIVKDAGEQQQEAITAVSEETMQADARAFAALMAEIRRVDSEEHTVVTVQVENETGLMAGARDHSDEADAIFNAPVPADFAAYMYTHTGSMVPEVREAVRSGRLGGSWEEMFGDQADELFSAYHVARYVNTVAAAGKREYPLPMSVNCWLNQKGAKAGAYPSGGPISKVREVWNFCAPAIDLYAPDIYLPDFTGICDEYTRRGEPL